jgi:hypothetical protein
MDRAMLERYLAEAERHVTEGGEHIATQRRIIAELERDSHDTTNARQSLKQFEELQAIHIANRDRLRRELGESV